MSPIFDYQASLIRMGNDESLLREMASLLLEDGPHRLREAQAGLQSHDAQRVMRAAHTLKGLAANFGAAQAVAAAAKLEDLARHEHWADMDNAAEALQQSWDELLHALRPIATMASESV